MQMPADCLHVKRYLTLAPSLQRLALPREYLAYNQELNVATGGHWVRDRVEGRKSDHGRQHNLGSMG